MRNRYNHRFFLCRQFTFVFPAGQPHNKSCQIFHKYTLFVGPILFTNSRQIYKINSFSGKDLSCLAALKKFICYNSRLSGFLWDFKTNKKNSGFGSSFIRKLITQYFVVSKQDNYAVPHLNLQNTYCDKRCHPFLLISRLPVFMTFIGPISCNMNITVVLYPSTRGISMMITRSSEKELKLFFPSIRRYSYDDT